MAMTNLDKMTQTLLARKTAKQDQIAMSGNLVNLHQPSVILSHEWRRLSPGSYANPQPAFRSNVCDKAHTAMTVKRAGRSAASCSGYFSAPSRTITTPFSLLRLNDRHDCQSGVRREARENGIAGKRLPGCGRVLTDSRGK